MAVVIFGIFFGMLEAIVVIYMRQTLDSQLLNQKVSPAEIDFSLSFIAFLKPSASNIIIGNQRILWLELWRETSTIVMLSTLAFAVGLNLRERLAYFLMAFAVWDIFYYVFLRIFTGWPASLSDLDIFFLIPVAWIGPVITPLFISSFLFLFSFLLLRLKRSFPSLT